MGTTLGLVILWLSSQRFRYVVTAAVEHLRLMAASQPIELLIDSPDTPPDLRTKLELVRRVTRFASNTLGLPDNGSYTRYVSLDQPQVAWNVFATPQLSTTPLEWCFPVVGCVVYRGYFSRSAAREFAAGLRRDGHDVYISRVTAYSTLGWFNDPVLSTFIGLDPQDLAGIIFHELAHQQLYAPGDSDFNEGFAVAVSREAVRRWLRSKGKDGALTAINARWSEKDAQVRLILKTRGELSRLFSSDLPSAEKRSQKQELLQELQDYICEAGNNCEEKTLPYPAGDDFQAINNAYLVSVATYSVYVPAFEGLLADMNHDLQRFYQRAEDLAALPMVQRRELLDRAFR